MTTTILTSRPCLLSSIVRSLNKHRQHTLIVSRRSALMTLNRPCVKDLKSVDIPGSLYVDDKLRAGFDHLPGHLLQLRPIVFPGGAGLALSNRRSHSIAVEAAANPSTRYSPAYASCLYRISKRNGWITTAPGLNFKNDASSSTSAWEADSAVLTMASDAEVESATVSLTDCRVKRKMATTTTRVASVETQRTNDSSLNRSFIRKIRSPVIATASKPFYSPLR